MSPAISGPERAGEPVATAGNAPGAGEAESALELPDSLQWVSDAAKSVWTPFREWMLEDGYVRVPAAIVILYLLKGLFGFLAVFGTRFVGLQAVTRLREELYDTALVQSDAFYRKRSTGDLYSRLLGDVGRLQSVLENRLAETVVAVPKVVVMLFVSMVFAWQIALACLLLIPAFVYSASRFGSRVKRSSRRSQERSAKMTSLVEETLTARRVVQAFGAVGREQARFRSAIARMVREDLKVAKAMAATPAVMELLGATLGAALLGFAGFLIHRGDLAGSDVMVAVIALFVVFSNARKLGELNNAIQHALAAARRVFEIIDEPVVVKDAPAATRLPAIASEVEIDHVSVGYGRGPVVFDIDMTIRKGEVHALVGPSGAGKSTLAMLIPRFMDPDQGVVRIDGHDLRSVTLASLRAQIAIVTQETHLFHGTIAENIAYGRPDASAEEIRQAARAANAASFIEKQDQAYDTVLGDKGAGLSTGQRQRVAMARAFLKDAPILILDEATSALDAESERLVQEALDRLLEGRTALIIAHRLRTVNRADVIHVLEAGREIETGTHEQLIRGGGLYARLNALQEAASHTGGAGEGLI